jgi:hypothetical protein
VRRPERQRGDCEPRCRLGCLLPVQGEVDHPGRLALDVTRSGYDVSTSS